MSIYHYTYLITNIIEEKHYIGSRSCKCLPTEDIGKKYFSSKVVEKDIDFNFQKHQKENPQEYQYQVLEDNFVTRTDAIAAEISLHNYFDVGNNPRFYNKAKQTSAGFDSTGIPRSSTVKAKIGLKNKGRKSKFKGMKRPLEIRRKLIKDKKIYNFIHAEFGEENLTRFDLAIKYSLSQDLIAQLVSGRMINVKGWRLNLPPKIKLPNHMDHTIYHFYHDQYGLFIGTRFDFKNTFIDLNLKRDGIRNLVSKNIKYRGWIIQLSSPRHPQQSLHERFR